VLGKWLASLVFLGLLLTPLLVQIGVLYASGQPDAGLTVRELRRENVGLEAFFTRVTDPSRGDHAASDGAAA